LQKCLRYFWEANIDDYAYYYAQYATGWKINYIAFPVTMRATPTSTQTSSAGTISEFKPTPTHTKYYLPSNLDSTAYSITAFKADAEL